MQRQSTSTREKEENIPLLSMKADATQLDEVQSDEITHFEFDELPEEVILIIANYLVSPDAFIIELLKPLQNFAKTNRRMNNIADLVPITIEEKVEEITETEEITKVEKIKEAEEIEKEDEIEEPQAIATDKNKREIYLGTYKQVREFLRAPQNYQDQIDALQSWYYNALATVLDKPSCASVCIITSMFGCVTVSAVGAALGVAMGLSATGTASGAASFGYAMATAGAIGPPGFGCMFFSSIFHAKTSDKIKELNIKKRQAMRSVKRFIEEPYQIIDTPMPEPIKMQR